MKKKKNNRNDNEFVKINLSRSIYNLLGLLFSMFVVVSVLYYMGKINVEMEKTGEAGPQKQKRIRFQQGDVIFQQIGGELGNRLTEIMESPVNHCGLIIMDGIDVFVLEAGEKVSKVPLKEWIGRGVDRRFALLGPKEIPPGADVNIKKAGIDFLNRPYDFKYKWDDEYIYCSELVFKAYQKGAGITPARMVKIKELPWEKHKDFVNRIMGGDFSPEREVITPVALYRSDRFRVKYDDFMVNGR